MPFGPIPRLSRAGINQSDEVIIPSVMFVVIGAPEYRAPRTEYRHTVQSTPPCTQYTVHSLILVSTQGKGSAVAILTGAIVVIYRLCIPRVEYILSILEY